MKKKLLVAALVSSMVASMSFTAFADETEATTEAEVEMVEAEADVNGDGKIIVGYISKNLTDPFHGPINEYATETLDAMVEDGIIDEWTGILDGNTDAPTQIDRASDCIAKGCDFVIILPCEAEASDPAVVSMTEAGINVIVVNSKTTSTDDLALTYSGSDDVYAGELLGNWILENCPDGGKYLHCNGILGNSAQIQRTEGMHNILDPHEEFEMVGDEDTQWKGDLAATAAENYIGKYGDELVAIICDNDDMSSAAQTACNSMGRDDIICVGVDGNQHPLEMIRDGELKGTVLQDGVGQMEGGIGAILSVIEAGEAPKNVTVPFVMVTEENVGDYLAE